MEPVAPALLDPLAPRNLPPLQAKPGSNTAAGSAGHALGRLSPAAREPLQHTLRSPAVAPVTPGRPAPASTAEHLDRLGLTESSTAPARRPSVRLVLLILIAWAVVAALGLVVVLGLVTNGPAPSRERDQAIVPPIEPVHQPQPKPTPLPPAQPQPKPQAPQPLPAPVPQPPAPLPTVVVPVLPATPLVTDPARQAVSAEPADLGRRPSSLLLLATPGDTLFSLYEQIYRGRTAPPFQAVQALNPGPVHPGTRLVFPAPTGGWPGAASPTR